MSKKFKNLKCRSGLEGTQSRLRDGYASYEEWENWSEMYGLHIRLGYKSPKTAWRFNPIVQSSVNPADFCKIIGGRRVFHDC